MSWDAYVNDQLIATHNIQEGAIIGHDGNNWASNPAGLLKAGEGAKIAAQFKDPQGIFASGIIIGGAKYLGIKAEGNSLYGKKGAGGVVIVKTGQAIIVGVYTEKAQPGPAAVTVEKLGDYLRENGY